MNELELKIKRYAQAYYEGEPLITDIEFDSLILQLKAEYPESDLLKTPGWGYSIESSHLKKYQHTFKCGSLDKMNVPKILDGIETWKPQENFTCSSKLDGNSAVAYYKNGTLERVLSRGDGDFGLDITANILHSIPQYITDQSITAIRGEVILTKSNFEKIGGSHPRNVATGLCQSKYSKSEELELLTFIPYWIKDRVSNLDTFHYLEQLGFKSIPVQEYFTFDEFISALRNEKFKDTFTWNELPIDGVVLTDEIGNQIAVKFEDESTTTVVKDIHWQLSRTGRLVPVLEVETVNLRGANISRVTANNVTWLKEQGCGIGSKIEIVRANEVIPKVIGVLEQTDISIPTHCPICSTELVSHNRDIVCPNDECESKLYKVFFNIFDSVGIDGIGPTVIDSVIEYFDFTSLNDIKDFITNYPVDELLYCLKPAKTELFIQCINSIRNNPITLKQLILNANIPNVGDSCTDLISDYYTNLNEFVTTDGNLPDELFPTYLAKDNLKKFWNRIPNLVTFYGFRVKMKEKSLVEKKVIGITLTGALTLTRPAMIDLFNELNPNVKVVEVSISKADYLVTNSDELTSSKGKAAIKKNIPIVNENKFKSIIALM